MAHRTAIPTIVLGGSDRAPARLPDGARDRHPLTGYKGVDIRLGGRPMVETLVERLAGSGFFCPVYIAGPASAYRSIRTSATVIDTNGTFSENIRVSLERVRLLHPGMPVAFTTCDVLPDEATLSEATESYWRIAPCDLFFPVVRVPEDRDRLGASAWKPTYRIPIGAGGPPIRILPGHLAIIDPDALRLEFLYRLLEIGYGTRNRSVARRLVTMLSRLLRAVLYQDLLHVLSLRAPTMTLDVVVTGARVAMKLHRGQATLAELEAGTRRIFARHTHQVRRPERRVRVPVLEGLSLALDVDTEEEAQQLGGEATSLTA